MDNIGDLKTHAMGQPRLTARMKAMLAALHSTLGIVTSACKAADIPSSTHYNWMQTNATYKAAVDAISDTGLDYAESKLFQLMEGVQVKTRDGKGTGIYLQPPNVAAIIFYLKTKGKNRGYIENAAAPPPSFDWVALAREAAEDERNLTDVEDGHMTMLLPEGVQVIDVEGRTVDEDTSPASTNGHAP